MQRVSAFLPSWDRSRSTHPQAAAGAVSAKVPASVPAHRTSRPLALDKVFGWAEKISGPGSRLSLTTVSNGTANVSAHTGPTAEGRYHRETYWPTTLDKEADKAARILKSFCLDGFLVEESSDIATIVEDGAMNETRTAEAGTTTDDKPMTNTGATTELGTQSRIAADGGATTTQPAVEIKKFSVKKIPPGIIQNALGLAIFSCVRSGLWMSGSGGAGLITARMSNGTWSPPSGIILHTASVGFVLGVDIYDCVLVINSVETLELFTRSKLTLGTDCQLSVGPLVDMEVMDRTTKWKGLEHTVLTYVRARGKHQPVQLDGSLIQERGNENERFYGAHGVGVLDILAGNIPKNVPEMKPLFALIKAAEGRTDYDRALVQVLAEQPAPGDAVIETPKTSPASAPRTPFGIPDADDPDPFGVLSLEMAGVEIREAGTRLRPTSNQFEFNPGPNSPLYSRFNRQSIDTYLSRSNRGSYMSAKTQATAVTDACTQTDVASTADTSFSRANSDDGRDYVCEKLPTVMEPDEVDYTKIDMSAIARFSQPRSSHDETAATTTMAVQTVATEPAARPQVEGIARDVEIESPKAEVLEQVASHNTEVPKAESIHYESSEYPADERDEDADDEDEEDEEVEDAIICEVATAQPTRSSIRASQVTQVIQAKGAIVNIPKRIPPPLPARSPARNSRASKSDFGGEVSGLKSPLRSSFLSVESYAPAADDEGTPETTSSEVFATPPAVSEDFESTKATLELEKPDVQGHRKNTSSVCTAVVTPIDTAPRVPPVPQALDQQPTSTPEESDHEPRTPVATDTTFVPSLETGEKQMVEKVTIATSHGHDSTNGVAIA